MSVIKRFWYYLIGVGFGVMLVLILFGNREFSCSYFPNDRVLSDLRKKELLYSMDYERQAQALQWTVSDVDTLLHIGNVDFGNSQTELDSCRIYRINGPVNGQEVAVDIENCSNVTRVLRIVE